MNFGEKYFSLLDEARKLSGNSEIILLAVSKKHEFTTLDKAYQEGIRHFGENSVQEGLGKIQQFQNKPLIANDLPIFHHIGPLQSGNIKKIIGNFSYVHGVGSFGSWKDLSKRALADQKNIYFFLQFNLTEENTKHGFTLKDISSVVEKLNEYTNDFCKCVGFMTMGPSDGEKIRTRNAFAQLRKIRDEFFPSGILSMGMSSDYKIALEEGSGLIRIGTAIFGERNYG
jgi:pyridoxal phosphate enzyme (YggS family)